MPDVNPLAVELNATIAASSPSVLNLLADRGKKIFFPTKGILGQTAEAKGKRINATIGTALEDDGSPLRLKCIEDLVNLDPSAFLYAPSYGRPELRQLWRERLREHNPSLGQKPISLPCVSQALTHALSMAGYLFLDPGDEILMPDLFWGNYKLTFENAWGARIRTHNTFVDGHFDIESMREALNIQSPGKRVVLLNFPNNPTGYTVTEAEAKQIVALLVEAAEAGSELVVIIDDAYFGLVYEEGILKESMFSFLADAHERILAVKIDGPTKEDYVWGFRVGFMTYGVKGATEAVYKALEAKTGGAIRGNISNASNLSQAILMKAFAHPEYPIQKQQKYDILKARYDEVCRILDESPEYSEEFTALPFNSGYFMCVRLHHTDAETIRQILLKDFDTGLIATSGLLRVAFSSAPTDFLAKLFDNIYQAAKQARQSA